MVVSDTHLRLSFLLQASEQLLIQSPETSRALMNAFQRVADQNQIPIAANTARRYCGYCGSIRVPGITTHVQTVSVKRPPRSERSLITDASSDKGQLKPLATNTRLECANCKWVDYIPGATTDQLAAVSNTKNKAGSKQPEPSTIIDAVKNTPNVVSAQSQQITSVQKKKKKNKKNELQRLVDQRRNNQSTKSSGYSLDDFLSSLG